MDGRQINKVNYIEVKRRGLWFIDTAKKYFHKTAIFVGNTVTCTQCPGPPGLFTGRRGSYMSMWLASVKEDGEAGDVELNGRGFLLGFTTISYWFVKRCPGDCPLSVPDTLATSQLAVTFRQRVSAAALQDGVLALSAAPSSPHSCQLTSTKRDTQNFIVASLSLLAVSQCQNTWT